MFKPATILAIFLTGVCCKYLEGIIRTSDNWAFVARFCFLSEVGTFEYFFEFSEDQGSPNLLLYYDSVEQWPAVYKKDKTCVEKEKVLNVDNFQIINLSPTKALSGCYYDHTPVTTKEPKYNLSIPTLRPRATPAPRVTVDDFNATEVDETTLSPEVTTSDFNETETVKPVRKRSVSLRPRRMGGRTIACHHSNRFRSARERWWFIALSNCAGAKGIYVKYRLLMTNGPEGDYWHEHFSVDEFYILPVLMAFSIAYSFLLLGVIVCSIELKSRQLLHTTYKIFLASILFQFFGIIFSSAAYLKYAINGLGPSRIRRFGAILMAVSETTFMLMLLLLAKGYTVTRGRLPLSASVKLTIFMCLYSVTFISLFIYEANVFDPGEVLYLYESPAGYGLIILRILAWLMFIYSTVFTLKRYPEKSNFYYPFNVCGTLWFVAGPAFIISANTYIDNWVRESIVCAVLQFITFGGHLMFLVLTMPSVANKNFPFHVRTSQIGVMELTGTSGPNTIENFGHHNYEPSGLQAPVIVPLTRRTEEIFEGMYHQQILRNRRDSSEEDVRDLAMENVAQWSLAKNIAAIDIPEMRRRRSSFGVDSSGNSPVLSRRSSQHCGSFQDYVREVPVELFTISRMVVANSGEEGRNENDSKTV